MLWTLPALHLCYGAGLIVGLCRPRYGQAADGDQTVRLRVVKPLGQPWELNDHAI